MQVSRWGNSLAVRLPASVVEALGLREGDNIVIEIAGDREFHISSEQARDVALQRLKRLNWKLPPGFIFRRPDDDVSEG